MRPADHMDHERDDINNNIYVSDDNKKIYNFDTNNWDGDVLKDNDDNNILLDSPFYCHKEGTYLGCADKGNFAVSMVTTSSKRNALGVEQFNFQMHFQFEDECMLYDTLTFKVYSLGSGYNKTYSYSDDAGPINMEFGSLVAIKNHLLNICLE